MESDIRFAPEFEFELPHSKSIEMAEAHRVNYSQEAEEMVNKLYKVYQEASYSFESMVSHLSCNQFTVESRLGLFRLYNN